MTAAGGPRRLRHRLLLPAAAVAAGLTVFAVLLITDGLHLVPAGAGAAAVLRLAAALAAGVAVVAAPRLAGRRPAGRRLRRLGAAWLAVTAALLTLHLAFEAPILVGDERVGSVIAFRPPCIEGSPVECPPGISRQDCLSGLGYRPDLIEACWGGGRILAVQLGLATLSLAVAGGFGGLIGLLLAARAGLGERPLRLFICYRRTDGGRAVDGLYPLLTARFGERNVFRDVETILPGEDFRQAVRSALAGCDVFLLVIGRRWLEVAGDDGGRRLADLDDPVRIEVEGAVARGLRIVPLLVDGAPMPSAGRLPEAFRELSNRSGLPVRGDPGPPPDEAFRGAVDRLIRLVERGEEGRR